MKALTKRRALLCAAALAISAPFAAPLIAQNAAPQPPGREDTSLITGGRYQADPSHTLVTWTVDHFGITPYQGIFGDITGTLDIDRQNPANSKVDITIPISKVTTASAGLTKHLLAPAKTADGQADFFGATPADARFVSTSVVIDKNDPDEAIVHGNLTLNGITRPVALEVEFYGAGQMPAAMGGKEQVGFIAETSILRSQFNINYGLGLVSDKVELDIVAAFTK